MFWFSYKRTVQGSYTLFENPLFSFILVLLVSDNDSFERWQWWDDMTRFGADRLVTTARLSYPHALRLTCWLIWLVALHTPGSRAEFHEVWHQFDVGLILQGLVPWDLISIRCRNSPGLLCGTKRAVACMCQRCFVVSRWFISYSQLDRTQETSPFGFWLARTKDIVYQNHCCSCV